MPNRNGAFPTYQIRSDTLRFDGAMPTYLPNPPSVTAALATAYNKVRVYYSAEMNHSDPEASNDSLNPDNYEFTGSVAIVPDSVAVVTANPTVVEITLTGEMTQGESYTVEVSNVLSTGGDALVGNTAAFTGFGISPRVASAEVMQPRCTRIHFDEAMKHDAALELESNYALTGPTSPTVNLISVGEILGITYADVFFTGDVTDGGAYHIEVSNVRDLAENLINTDYDTGDFTGFNPEVASAAAQADGLTVRLSYNTEMRHTNPLVVDDSLNPNNYEISGPLGLQTVTSVSLYQANPTIVDLLLTSEMNDGGSYTATVSNVHTIGGYDLYVTDADFTGIGISPQVDTVESLAAREIRVIFDELMRHDAALETPGNYAITGPTSPTTTNVDATDVGGVTQCDVTFTGAITHGGLYQVEVSNVLDVAENIIDPDHDTGTFTGISPEVSSAVAQTATKVRVNFNTEVKHSNAGNIDDALNFNNYEISGPSTSNVTAVELYEANPTSVDLTLDTELSERTYTVTVSNVKTIDEYALYDNTADFEGIGVPPEIERVVAVTNKIVRVYFSELMLHNDALTSPDSYVVSASPPIPIVSVSATDVGGKTYITIVLADVMLSDLFYTVTIVGTLEDLHGNPLDPEHLSETFLNAPKVYIRGNSVHDLTSNQAVTGIEISVAANVELRNNKIYKMNSITEDTRGVNIVLCQDLSLYYNSVSRLDYGFNFIYALSLNMYNATAHNCFCGVSSYIPGTFRNIALSAYPNTKYYKTMVGFDAPVAIAMDVDYCYHFNLAQLYSSTPVMTVGTNVEETELLYIDEPNDDLTPDYISNAVNAGTEIPL